MVGWLKNTCCIVNENGPIRFIHLNAWSPVGATIWGRFNQIGLVGGVSLGVGLEVSKAHTSLNGSLYASTFGSRFCELSAVPVAQPLTLHHDSLPL